MNFLQWWRQRASKIKLPILEEQQIGIIIANVDTNLSFQLKMQCSTSYEELIPRALNIERALTEQGNTQAYKDNFPSTSSNDKPHVWAMNKNITNDGFVDVKVVLSAPRQTNTQPMNTQQTNMQPQNDQVNNTYTQRGSPPRNNYPRWCKYTPLGEPIEAVMQNLVQFNLIMHPNYQNYQESQVKPP